MPHSLLTSVRPIAAAPIAALHASTLALTLALALVAAPALAVGSDDSTPPTPTETTTTCTDGKIWDVATQTCVTPRDARLDDDTRYRAAREFAYADRFDAARAALDAMTDQDASRVLTYRGFIARKTGDWATAEAFYVAALAIEPDNLLARSYFGQGLLATGDRAGAVAQLDEIHARGGAGGWPEHALAMALQGNTRIDY